MTLDKFLTCTLTFLPREELMLFSMEARGVELSQLSSTKLKLELGPCLNQAKLELAKLAHKLSSK